MMCVEEEWQQLSHLMAQPLLHSVVSTSALFEGKFSKCLQCLAKVSKVLLKVIILKSVGAR